MAYTKDETATLRTYDEVTYDQAVALGVELGKSTKSIISKVQSLEITYVKKAVPAPKAPQATKAELITAIEEYFDGVDLQGLSGSTRDALVNISELIDSI